MLSLPDRLCRIIRAVGCRFCVGAIRRDWVSCECFAPDFLASIALAGITPDQLSDNLDQLATDLASGLGVLPRDVFIWDYEYENGTGEVAVTSNQNFGRAGSQRIVVDFTVVNDAPNESPYLPQAERTDVETTLKSGVWIVSLSEVFKTQPPVFLTITEVSQPTGGVSDPHFVAGNGLKFDFMGEADKSYCLLSDTLLHMNMHMVGPVATHKKRSATWIRDISILYYPYYNISITAASPEGTPFTAAHGTVVVNGKEMKSQKQSTMVRWHGLTVSRRKTRISVEIKNLVELEIEVVRAGFWVGEDGPGSNYLNFKIKALNVTRSVHGLLGQTFRPSFNVREHQGGKQGQGVIEGNMHSYEVSDMLATDCKFARYARFGKAGVEGVTADKLLSSGEMHAWQGNAGGDSDYTDADDE
eukprot:jgi/Mesvir1/21364/Mv20848-RA.1